MSWGIPVSWNAGNGEAVMAVVLWRPSQITNLAVCPSNEKEVFMQDSILLTNESLFKF